MSRRPRALGLCMIVAAAGAAHLHRERGASEDAINGYPPADVATRGLVLRRDGIPLVVDVIGIFADTPDHGEQIANTRAAMVS